MDSTSVQVKFHQIDGLKAKHLRLSIRLHFRNQSLHTGYLDTRGSTSINCEQVGFFKRPFFLQLNII